MRPIVAIEVAWSLCLSAKLSITMVSPAETAEQIDMPFGLWTRVGPKNHYIRWGPVTP